MAHESGRSDLARVRGADAPRVDHEGVGQAGRHACVWTALAHVGSALRDRGNLCLSHSKGNLKGNHGSLATT